MNVKEVMCHKQAVPLETQDTVVKAIADLYPKKFAKLLPYLIVGKLPMNSVVKLLLGNVETCLANNVLKFQDITVNKFLAKSAPKYHDRFAQTSPKKTVNRLSDKSVRQF